MASKKKKEAPPRPPSRSFGFGTVFLVGAAIAAALAVIPIGGVTGWQRVSATGLPARAETESRQLWHAALERYHHWQSPPPPRLAHPSLARRPHVAPKETLAHDDRAALDKLVADHR